MEQKVKDVVDKIRYLKSGSQKDLPEDFVPKPLQFLSINVDVANSFKGLVGTLKSTSSVDEKTQALIKAVLSAAYKCKDCLKFHVLEALRYGATNIEIRDAFYCGTLLGGTSYLAFAFEVLEELDLV